MRDLQAIAEALLATALGLVAAIPAVVIYNHFARAIAAHRAVVADVRANAVAVVGVPQRGVVILGAREQEVALLVVLDERQRPG